MSKKTIFSIATICSIGIFVFASYVVHLPGLYRLYRRPAVTEGSITGKRPENRSHVTYRFSVNSKLYDAEGAVGDAYESIAIGATVPVIYDPTDPNVSCIYDLDHPDQWHLRSPKEVFISALVVISVFSLIGGFVCALSFSLTRRFI